jgi:glucokinase-like ROK family protein
VQATPTGNAEYINRLNKIRVLSLIREKGEVSRSEIVKLTGLSAPTVTRVVDSLISREKLAVEAGTGKSGGGRPPLMVRFNGNDTYVIGIDWGRTHIFGTLSNLNAEPEVQIDLRTKPENDFAADLQRVSELIEDLLRQSGIERHKLRGIGVAAAGFVNRESGIIEYSPNFNWIDADIRQPLHDRFRVPVIVDNVSRVMALGELIYGIGSYCRDFIFINAGYGIGAGIIVNGQPFKGFDGFAGEVGHTRVDALKLNSRRCVCGKSDCLENYASGRGIAEMAREGLPLYPGSMIHEMCRGNPALIDSEMVAEAARAGDVFASLLFAQAAEYIGVAMANMANMFNPSAIVTGGKVFKAGTFFTNHIRSVFERETLQQPKRRINILECSLGDEAAVKGAVSLILQEILNFSV